MGHVVYVCIRLSFMGQAVYVCVLDCHYGTRGICLCVYIRLSLMGHKVYVCVCVH
jgi:hypothetical protein